MKLSGEVVRGEGLGGKIGIPTANVAYQGEPPARGVWAVDVEGYGKAVCNVGVRPTVSNSGKVTVEVHLPNYTGDLYGKTLTLTFTRKIRDEKKFNGLDELKAQIALDIAEALR